MNADLFLYGIIGAILVGALTALSRWARKAPWKENIAFLIIGPLAMASYFLSDACHVCGQVASSFWGTLIGFAVVLLVGAFASFLAAWWHRL